MGADEGVLEGGARGACFLDVALSEDPETGVDGRDDPVEGLLLGDTDQPDLLGLATGSGGGGGDPVVDGGQALGGRGAQGRVGQAVLGGHDVGSSRECPASSSRAIVSSIGRPITFVRLPSTPVTNRRPSPCSA